MQRASRHGLPALALAVLAGLSPLLAVPTAARPTEAPAGDARILDASGLPPPNGTTTLVSQNVTGDFPSGPSLEPSISENGRYVAFSSIAADLVADDTNQAQDVFFVDRRNGRAVRLPLPGGGPVPQGGRAYEPSIAADASAVAFTYMPPPTTLAAVGSVVMLWDRDQNETQVVSLRLDGSGAQNSREPSVSGDGRSVAYTSDNGRIVPSDGNGSADVFVIDRQSGVTTLVSARPAGGVANGDSAQPAISSNGRVVAFTSTATDLIGLGGATGAAAVYVRDLEAGTTELVSVTPNGGYANAPSLAPAVSANGNVVAFESSATDLVGGDTNVQDVFVRDREAGTTVIASIGVSGGPSDGPSGQAALAADGRIVAFVSRADDLVAAATPSIRLAATAPGRSEVFARELVVEDTILISEAVGGGPGGETSIGPTVGGNGRFVAFASNSAQLVNGDGAKLADVFLRDLPGDPVVAPPLLDFGSSALGQPSLPIGAIVSNRGWAPVRINAAERSGNHAADFDVLADGCDGQRLRRARSCTITVGFTPSARGTRTATLEVPGAFGGSPRTADLRGRGSRAVIELDPPIGDPGIVTVVSGRGFPPGATVGLSWSRGITPTLPPILVDDDGRFRTQVLVFHNDVLGIRDLVATRLAGPAFPDVTAEMLVVAAPNIPSSSRWQLSPPFTPPLIIRR